MLIGKDSVLGYFDLLPEECTFWSISYAKTGGNPIASTSKENVATKTASREELEKVLALLGAGAYQINIKEDPKAQRGFFSEKFEVPVSQNPFTNNTVNGIGNAYPDPSMYIKKEEVHAMIGTALEAERQKREMDEMRAELVEAKRELKNREAVTFSSQVAGYMKSNPQITQALISGLTSKIFPTTAVGLAGFNENGNNDFPPPPIKNIPTEENLEIEESTDELTNDDRFNAVVDAFVELEGSEEGALHLLECFVNWANENKTTYEIMKPQILNFKKSNHEQ